jgi:hypothetical protein
MAEILSREIVKGITMTRKLHLIIASVISMACSLDVTDIAGYNWRVASFCGDDESDELVEDCTITSEKDVGNGVQRSLICDVDGATVELFVRCTPELSEQTATLGLGIDGCQVALACKARM